VPISFFAPLSWPSLELCCISGSVPSRVPSARMRLYGWRRTTSRTAMPSAVDIHGLRSHSSATLPIRHSWRGAGPLSPIPNHTRSIPTGYLMQIAIYYVRNPVSSAALCCVDVTYRRRLSAKRKPRLSSTLNCASTGALRCAAILPRPREIEASRPASKRDTEFF